jgi:hypothetical protein
LGAAWSYELKFDGYRALGVKANGKVRLGLKFIPNAHCRLLSATPAIDRIDVEAPLRTHAKAGDLPFVSQTVNRVRMNA